MAKPKVKTNRGKIGAGWSREFYDPIPVARGRQLVTLKDAGTYITELPKAEQKLAEWQTAMQVELYPVTSRMGIVGFFSRIVWANPIPFIFPGITTSVNTMSMPSFSNSANAVDASAAQRTL
jgi:hypothetical protein